MRKELGETDVPLTVLEGVLYFDTIPRVVRSAIHPSVSEDMDPGDDEGDDEGEGPGAESAKG